MARLLDLGDEGAAALPALATALPVDANALEEALLRSLPG